MQYNSFPARKVGPEPPPTLWRLKDCCSGSEIVRKWQDLKRESSGENLKGLGSDARPASSEAIGHAYDVLLLSLPKLRIFSLHGEFFHAMLSYRVQTEGRWAKDLQAKLHELSLTPEFNIPQAAWGHWPSFAQEPTPKPKRGQINLFLDKDCLKLGQSWEAGFVQGVESSLVFVPLLSWFEEGDKAIGSLGAMKALELDDRVDNVLLEYILAIELRKISESCVKAILPIMIGPIKTGAPNGVDSESCATPQFPNTKDILAKLPDKPSMKTNDCAALILLRLGVGSVQIQEMLKRSVRDNVEMILKHQAITWPRPITVDEDLEFCAKRILKTVLSEIKAVRSDPVQFQLLRPQGSEVIQWLQQNSLMSYAPIFAENELYTLALVARMTQEHTKAICAQHDNAVRPDDSKHRIGSEVVLMEAISRLRVDPKARRLCERLDTYSDTAVSAWTVLLCNNAVEVVLAKHSFQMFCVIGACGTMAVSFTCLYASCVPFQEWSLPHANSNEKFEPLVIDVGNVFFGVSFGPTAFGYMLSFVWLARRYGPKKAHGAVLQFLLVLSVLLLLLSITVLSQCAYYDGVGRYCAPREYVAGSAISLIFFLVCKYRQAYFFRLFFLVFTLWPGIAGIGYWVDAGQSKLESDYFFAELFTALSAFFAIAAGLSLLGIKIVSKNAKGKVAEDLKDYQDHWKTILKNEEDRVLLEQLKKGTSNVLERLIQQWIKCRNDLPFLSRMLSYLRRETGRFAGKDGKIRQRSADIEALFAQASTVNEPFQHLVGSLLAQLRAVTEARKGSVSGHGTNQTGNFQLTGTYTHNTIKFQTVEFEPSQATDSVKPENFEGEIEYEKGAKRFVINVKGPYSLRLELPLQVESNNIDPTLPSSVADFKFSVLNGSWKDVNATFNEDSCNPENPLWEIHSINFEEEPPDYKLIVGPVKNPERAIQKCVRSFRRDAACLTDLVRCTVLLDEVGQLCSLFDLLNARSLVGFEAVPSTDVPSDEKAALLRNDVEANREPEPSVDRDQRLFRITRMKNRFDPEYSADDSAGYRDLSLNVEVFWVMEGGVVKFLPVHQWDHAKGEQHICEIQVHLHDIHEVIRKGTHLHYVEWRDLLTR